MLGVGAASGMVFSAAILGWFERLGYAQLHIIVLSALLTAVLVPFGLLIWSFSAARARRSSDGGRGPPPQS